MWERFGLPGLPAVGARTYLALSLAELGTFAEGLAIGEEGIHVAHATERPFDLVRAYVGVGMLHLRKGDLPRAISAFERCLEFIEVGNIHLWFPWTASALGYAYALAGRLNEAVPLVEQAMEQAVSRHMVGHHALWVGWLSEAYLLARRTQDATELAGRALALSRKHKERGNEAWTLRLLGEIHAQLDPPAVESAEEYYRQALALAEELGMRPLLAHCHLGRGILHLKMNTLAQAHSELATAIELLRAMEMPFWLGRAEERQR